MTRTIIIAIPPTTDYTIVFPHDAVSKRFDSGFYAPGLTDGRASREEIDQVLNEVENVRRPLASKIVSALCCYIFGLFAAIGSYVFFMVAMAGGDPELIPFFVIGFIGLIVALVWIFVVRVKNLTEQIKTKSRQVIDRHNPSFASRGLRWHVPVHFPRWIELWKDYRAGNNPQPIYMPPVHQQPYTPTPNYGAPNQNAGQPQFQQNYYQNYQGPNNNNNMYIPPSQV